MCRSPQDYQEQKERFARASELEGEARRWYLDETFAGDPEGRAQLEQLLAADEQASSFLRPGGPGVEGGAGALHPREIGPYRILGVLGQGGMGIVYRAQQQQPQREVALKVLRSTLVDPSILRRFEHEAEVLGRLSHPGIARVYEAGKASVGGVLQPYFALELIEGVSLVEHAQREHLPLQCRIELLAEVCDAVEHAHRKAVVHRDLKPGNILVDGDGQVKVLDFGIARVLDAEARASSLVTASGMVIGTLAYMSPEQASGRSKIDARTDVWSLGVLAFELFSGRMPHDLAQRSFHAAVAAIVEGEPQRLGTVAPALRGDLEVVVGHALEKEPARRYPSAAALADDLRRVLRDESIQARPPSSFYQLARFARRNRVLVAGVASTIVALAAGLVVSLGQFRRAEAARGEAEEEARIATLEANKARSINDFVLDDMLAAPDPWAESGDIRVSEVLDRAAERVEQRFENDPALEASVRATLGGSYMARGLYPRAHVQLRRAVELRRELHPEDHPDLARSLLDLSTLEEYRGESAVAEELGREAVAMCHRLYDGPADTTGDALLALGRALVSLGEFDAAREVLLECRAVREGLYEGAHPELMTVQADLGSLEHYAQRFDEATQYQLEALQMAREVYGPTSPFVGVALNDLAQTEMAVLPRERRGEAIERMRAGIVILDDSIGPEHAVTIRSRRNLGIGLGKVGEEEEAEALLLDAYELSVSLLGPEHLDSVQSGNSVAHFLMARQRNAEALEILDEVVPIALRVLGEDHPDALIPMFNQGWLLRRQGRLEEALGVFGDAHRGLRAAHGPDAWRTLLVHKDLLTLLIELGRLEQAGTELRAIAKHTGALGGPDYETVAIDIAEAANMLGGAAMAREEFATAAEHLTVGHELCVALWSVDDWRAADTASKLGACLAASGRVEEGRAHLVQAFEALGRATDAPASLLPAARERLVAFHEERGESVQAASYRE